MKDAVVQASSGALAGIIADMVFYGVDSYKVMKQVGEPLRLGRLFRGMVPVAVLGSGPSFGIFFLTYEVSKSALEGAAVSSSSSVLAASLLAGIPSSLSAVPADVLKKRIVLSSSNLTMFQMGREILAKEGVAGLFLGWRANMIKDLPFVAIKMSLYEGTKSLYLQLKQQYFPGTFSTTGRNKQLSLVDYGVIGFASGALTAVMTTPLDCVNTRIKTGELKGYGILAAHGEIVKRDGVAALFRGLGPRTLIISLGSSVFWSVQNALIKVIQ